MYLLIVCPSLAITGGLAQTASTSLAGETAVLLILGHTVVLVTCMCSFHRAGFGLIAAISGIFFSQHLPILVRDNGTCFLPHT